MKVHNSGKPITLRHILKGVKDAILLGVEVLDIPIDVKIVDKDGGLSSFILTDIEVTDDTVQINGRSKK